MTAVGASGSGVTVAARSAADVAAAPEVRLRTVFRRFWPDTRPFRGRMLLGLLLVPISPALSTASVYLFKVLVDDVLTPHDFRLFIPVAIAYLAITVAGGLVGFADEYLTAWVGERFVTDLRVRVFRHLHRLSIGWFDRHQLGDVLARLTGDVGAIEQLVLTGVNLALTYTFQVVFYTAAMVLLDWRLAVASLLAAPAFLLISRAFSRHIRDASRERRRRSGSIAAVAEESLGNVALVQSYDRSADEVARFAEENRGSFRAQLRAVRLEALFGPFTGLVEAIGVLVVAGVAVYELAQGAVTLGGLLAFLGYLGQLYAPVQGFAGLSTTAYAATAGAERILELLDEEPAVTEPDRPEHLGRARGGVTFSGVRFRYPGADTPALRGVDLHIAPGRTVAVVGASGAGKTTLTKLLLRAYDPDAGRITLDGHDLRELSLTDLRRNVAAVLQETLVFDGTVAENIRWGRPCATDAAVVAAATAADAHGFITALDDGYDTRVGQRGRMLSGGQRQRLAIARAMIRDAPVLVLDEPTTGLDAESTRRVLGPLRRLMAGRSTIVISHDLLTVADVDEIVFLADGLVEAVGPHEHLLATCPGYARLYALHRPDGGPHPQRPGPVAGRRRGPAPAARPPGVPRPAPAVGDDRPTTRRLAVPVPMPRRPEPGPDPLPTMPLPRVPPRLPGLPAPRAPRRPDDERPRPPVRSRHALVTEELPVVRPPTVQRRHAR